MSTDLSNGAARRLIPGAYDPALAANQTTTSMEKTVGQETTGCPTCQSADTISTGATLARDTRHCFCCRRSFDIELSGPLQRRLRREDRSNALPSERRR